MKTLFAHRGMSSLAPENTHAAFALCAEFGLRWVECDVDILADGTLVIFHDDTLERCTDRTGFLSDLTFEDLKTIDAGGWFGPQFIGEKILTFSEFIALTQTHKLNINVEIKASSKNEKKRLHLIEGVIAGLKGCHQECEVLVSSFSHALLAEFKKQSPNTPVACLFEKIDFQSDWESSLRSCQSHCVHLSEEGLTQASVLEIKSKGYRLHVYTVNSLFRANELFLWGVDGIFTDAGQLFSPAY